MTREGEICYPALMFSWIRRWRRARLERRPLPAAWREYLEKEVPFYLHYSEAERAVFLRLLKVFVAEKHWTGGGGATVSEEMKVVIGACAVRLVLKLGLSSYDRLSEIIVYPYNFQDPETGEETYGEALDFGVVVLSWPAVLAGLARSGEGVDTASHEFAHVLDNVEGAFDGTPRLRNADDYRRWAAVMSAHFLNLQRGRGRASRFIDDYGAVDEAEFFAVASEAFFERGEEMKKVLPDLYGELRRFYGYDPPAEKEPPPAPSRRRRRAARRRRG